jgi:hypothetical protein
MDPMYESDDTSPNAKVILLAVGGAALAALLIALARRDDEKSEVAAHAEATVADLKKDAKKAAKEAKRKQKEMKGAAVAASDRVADEVRTAAEKAGIDVKTAERDLKAAAWDAQQEAREAESRLRAAGHRVVDDAAHIASRLGGEARHLAGEGREKFAHLRHREEGEGTAEHELERLRAEIDELKTQLGRAGKRVERPEKDFPSRAFRFSGKGGTSKEAMASEAAAAALAQLERALRAKAPQLIAAKNRGQVLEILQQDLGPTLRDTVVQAATAALAMWEAARHEADEAADQGRDTAHHIGSDLRAAAGAVGRDARQADAAADAAATNGKRWLWRSGAAGHDADGSARETAGAAEGTRNEEEEHRSKAGLLWGGAGLGLALYALLDAERRERVIQLANEASIQVQELVRDLQGYDDEF